MATNSSVPSWNDPPPLKFDATASSTKPRLLSKRVFTPLNKCEQSSSLKDCSEVNQIPIPAISEKDTPVESDHAIPKNYPTEAAENCGIPSSDLEILTFVSDTLKSILSEYPEKCEKTTKEIDRRLDIMEKSWDGDLSIEVKHMMFKLAQELCKGNIDAALKIHCSLMVQYVREVKNWMVGVKKIIEMRKENLKLPVIDNEELEENSI